MIFIHFQFVHFEEFATKSFDHHHRHVVPIQQLSVIKDISITTGSSFFFLPLFTHEISLACERHIDTHRFPGYLFWTRMSLTNQIESNKSFWTIRIGEQSTNILPRMVSEYPGLVRSFIPIIPLVVPGSNSGEDAPFRKVDGGYCATWGI
jgi:hypothetical protein